MVGNAVRRRNYHLCADMEVSEQLGRAAEPATDTTRAHRFKTLQKGAGQETKNLLSSFIALSLRTAALTVCRTHSSRFS